MKVRSFRDVLGTFTLMTPQAAARFAGVSVPELPPVRIVEDGPVRTIVEALLEWQRSAVCLRYVLPRQGSELLVQVRVAWHERDTMLKLSVPTTLDDMTVRSEVAYGVEHHTRTSDELLGHTWVAGVSGDGRHALTLINDGTYGFDVAGSALRPTLLRSPAYAGHPVDAVTPIVRQDRFEPRVDQGDHVFQFWLNAGPATERLALRPPGGREQAGRPARAECVPLRAGQGRAAGADACLTTSCRSPRARSPKTGGR